MEKFNQTIATLSLFNGITLSKTQWLVVLQGCGCPKTHYFWAALRDECMTKDRRAYTLLYFDAEAFNRVWSIYSRNNSAGAAKAYRKKKVRAKIQNTRRAYTVNPDGTVSLGFGHEWDRD